MINIYCFLAFILCHRNLVTVCFLIEIIFRNGSNTWPVLDAIVILSLKSISNVSEEIGIFALKMQRIN